ncbi:hypothetical protein CFI00_20675 [Nocardioides sp. S5]|nr:hypothetical protein CFI00_20675 [Nocardioides sp. S5]
MSPTASASNRVLRQAVSLGLRVLSLGSKFLVVLLMAKYLSAREVGIYGLIASGTGYLLLVVGLDFYTYTTREMLRAPQARWAQMIHSQGALMLVQYAVVVPFVLLAMLFADAGLVAWFGVILVLEHLAQEMNRLFVTMEKQIAATFIMFFRVGGWCVVAIPALWLIPAARDLDVVLALWVGSLLLGIGVGGALLAGQSLPGWRDPVDWAWVRRGARVALPLLLATLALRSLLNLDRFVVQGLGGLEVVGAYVLFMGIAAALLALIESGVVVYYYPAMVRAVSAGEFATLRRAMKHMSVAILVVAVPFIGVAMLLRDPLLTMLDEAVYAEHADVLLPALLAMSALALSLVPHYGLYAYGRDRPLLAVNSCMAAGFIGASAVLLAEGGGPVAVPWTMTACLVAGGAAKWMLFSATSRKRASPGPVPPG